MNFIPKLNIFLIAIAYILALEYQIKAEEEKCLIIDSNFASYQGKQFFLKGDVVLEHTLGKIYAQIVELNPSIEKKNQWVSVILSENVHIDLKNGASIECAKATIDFKTRLANFNGNAAQEYVIYTEYCKNTDKANSSLQIPIVFKSKRLMVQFLKEKLGELNHSSNNPLSNNHISSVLGEDSVSLNYNDDFIILADVATYDKEMQENLIMDQPIPGLISMRANGPEGICKVTNREGDFINALTVYIDTIQKKTIFISPQGVLKTSCTEFECEKLEFSANTLAWDLKSQLLVLKDHVILEQKGLGRLTNDHEIRLNQKTVNGKRLLNTIESDGKTVVSISDKTKDLDHQLTCYGKLIVDHAKLEMQMESPIDTQGNVLGEFQVYFEDSIGEIHADRVILKYTLDNKTLVPKELFLEGNVRMLNTYASEANPTSPLIQYALADRVQYDPQTKEVIFSSIGKKKRVLFYDKANNLQVSAHHLKIKRDQATKKDLIKGTGDVRFSFMENEFEQLRTQFKLSHFFKRKERHGSK
jgi:hypothetical protein